MREHELKEKLEGIFFHDSEQIDEYITFFILIKKFGRDYVKRIYSRDIFNKRIEILDNLNAFDDCESEISLSLENFNNINLINIDWLRYFIILAETENFDVAADKLNISPRTLQKAIFEIENFLKVELINGKNNFSRLTYEGKLFLEKARKVIQNLFDLKKNIDFLNREKNMVNINISWVSFFSPKTLTDVISSLKYTFPDIYLKIHLIRSYTEKWIENGEIDVGLILGKPKLKSIGYYKGKKVPYVIIGKPEKKRHWEELKYFTLPKDNPKDPDYLDKIFGDRIISEVYFDLMLYLCEEGLGSAFVPLFSVKDRIEKGSLAIIADPPVEKYETPYIIYNKNISMNNVVSTFINEVTKKISE